ncbi:leucine-rich repeat protein [Butyrivibrio sp. VCD2006]|uniref:leucine-rich repeat protein n=1 Tax=Butyrivibrio sp. VCD2006 TaxID=1280664 RepID=UPI00040CC30E|nr:BspA family leucine-rich repeat surface protein [Butyrivibrio sp. VCD2006]
MRARYEGFKTSICLFSFAVAFFLLSFLAIPAKAQITSNIDLGTNVTGEYDDSTRTLTILSNDGDLDGEKFKSFLNENHVFYIKTATNSSTLHANCNFLISEDQFVRCAELYNIAPNSVSCNNMFFACTKLSTLKLSFTDTSNVLDISNMFAYLPNLANLEINGFDTSNVNTMAGTFYGCSSIKSLNLSFMNTASVTDMRGMFENCNSLESLDLSLMETSSLKEISGMFYNCSNLKNLDLSTFNTSKVKDMSRLFYNCTSLQKLDLSSFDTTKVDDYTEMFYYSAIDELDISSFEISSFCNMDCMFSGANIKSIKGPASLGVSIPLGSNQGYYKLDNNGIADLDTKFTEIPAGSASATYVCGSEFDSVECNVDGVDTYYDGDPHSISINVTKPTSGYTITYSIDDINYSEEKTTFTDCGNYTVYYKITAPNHIKNTGNASVVINKSYINCEAEGVDTAYDGNPHSISVNVTTPASGYAIEYSTDDINYDTEKPEFTDSGEYTVYYKITDPNYNDKNGHETVRISKSNIISSASGIETVYDGTPHSISVNVNTPISGYEVEYSTDGADYSTEKPSFIDAGDYTVYYKITAPNYNDKEGHESVKIIKNTIAYSSDGTETNYDGQEHSISVNVTAPTLGYTVEYSTDGTDYSTEKPSFIDAGDYTVYYKITAPNYNDKEGHESVKIIKNTIAYSSDGTETNYDGQEHSISVNVTAPTLGYTVEYSTDGTDYSTENPIFTDAGDYTVYYKIIAANYYTQTGHESVKISKSTMVYSSDGTETYYDGLPHTISVDVTKPASGYNVEYSSDGIDYFSEKPTFTDAGNYTVYYKISSPNYNEQTGSETVKIKKEDIAYSAEGVDTYNDGKSHSISVKVYFPSTGYSIVYSTDGINYSATNPSFSANGTHKVYFKITHQNYNAVIDNSSVKISKASISNAEISLSNSTYTYDGTAKKPTATVSLDGVLLYQGTDYSVDYSNNINAGTATITITGKGNKYSGTSTVNYTISKASIKYATISLDKTTEYNDGFEKKPLALVSLNGAILTQNIDYILSYENNVNVGTARVNVAGINNYDNSCSTTFSILPGSNNDSGNNNGSDNNNGSNDNSNSSNGNNNTNPNNSTAPSNNTEPNNNATPSSNTNPNTNPTPDNNINGGNYTYDGNATITGECSYTITDKSNKEIEVDGINIEGTEVVIPATVVAGNEEYTVTSVGESAFSGNANITSITLPDTVTTIEPNAFKDCTSLSSVKLGNGVETISANAFRKCTKLKSVTLPGSLKEIGKNAFNGCKNLKSITIKGNKVVAIKANAIKGINKKAVIKVPKKLVQKYQKKFTKKTGFKNSMKIKKK